MEERAMRIRLSTAVILFLLLSWNGGSLIVAPSVLAASQQSNPQTPRYLLIVPPGTVLPVEIIATVGEKYRLNITMPHWGRPEQGSIPGRADQAVAIVVDSVRMSIIDKTIVKKADGTLIDFNEMPVPCQARIVYQPLRGEGKNVLEIQIINPLSGATTRWNTPGPQ
ncbi:MAG: hypothetical protein WCV64_09175 [Desulfurivibrionaceae bacterium]|jgi:hypothetical protein